MTENTEGIYLVGEHGQNLTYENDIDEKPEIYSERITELLTPKEEKNSAEFGYGLTGGEDYSL